MNNGSDKVRTFASSSEALHGILRAASGTAIFYSSPSLHRVIPVLAFSSLFPTYSSLLTSPKVFSPIFTSSRCIGAFLSLVRFARLKETKSAGARRLVHFVHLHFAHFVHGIGRDGAELELPPNWAHSLQSPRSLGPSGTSTSRQSGLSSVAHRTGSLSSFTLLFNMGLVVGLGCWFGCFLSRYILIKEKNEKLWSTWKNNTGIEQHPIVAYSNISPKPLFTLCLLSS